MKLAAVKFTPCELRILELCCSDLTYKEIAAKLKLSPRTVEHTSARLAEKVGMRNRCGLVAYAISHSMVRAQL